jgi:DNA-binding transcriptional ArsR family regulator
MTMAPRPRSTRRGAPVPGWKAPDPNIEARDQMVYRLAYVEGVLDQTEIVDRISRAGFNPVSPDRIGQVLRADSRRDRILRFLADAPEGQTFTVRDLTQALSVDAGRISYALDALAKKGLVTFRNVRNDGVNSGDHKTKIDIMLNKKAKNSAAVKSAIEREPASRPTLVPFADQAAADTRLHEMEVTISSIRVTEDPYVLLVDDAVEATVSAEALGEEINGLEDGKPVVQPPWIVLAEWPEFSKIRNRAVKASKINAAIKLLEEAGEDDIAFSLMVKIDFTPLELEVTKLLHMFEEIE